MKIRLTPSRADFDTKYLAEGEVLHVSVGGASDTFDFSVLAEGDEAVSFKSDLPINPVVWASRIEGDVVVEFIAFYGADHTEDEKQVREVIL